MFLYFRVYVEQSSDGRGLDLIFRSLDKSDEGNYSCTATLDGIKEQQNVTLKIVGNKSMIYLLYKLYVCIDNVN